jgi:hypothetical protein
VVVYGRAATLAGPAASVLRGWAAFLLGVAVLRLVQPPPALSLVFVSACFALGLRLLPPPADPPAPIVPPSWDLPARALAALALVLALTAVSGALGPHLSGLLAPFPIITSVLAVFTHAHGGAAQLDLLLRNFLVGFYGFSAFCFVLALALPALSIAAAFGLATGAALAVQAGILVRSPLR